MNTYVFFDLKQYVANKWHYKTVSKVHMSSRAEPLSTEKNNFSGFMLKMLKVFDAEEPEMLWLPIHKAVMLPNLSKTLGEWVTRTAAVVKTGKQGHVCHQNQKWN